MIKSKTPEYRAWDNMIQRCYNSGYIRSYRYLGKGIVVCDRWRSSFDNFLEDMGYRPSPLHSLDRINNDGNYEAGNCRWATSAQQAANSGTYLNSKNLYPGVYVTRNNKYCVILHTTNNKQNKFGTYIDLEEALSMVLTVRSYYNKEL